MSSILRYFSGWRNISVNVSQIILVGFLLPFAALIMSFFVSEGDEFSSVLISWVGQIPLFEVAFEFLSNYVNGITSSDITNITLLILLKAFPDALLVGICVHVCTELFNINWNPLKNKFRSFRPLPILPAFLGIFLSAILVKTIGLTGNAFLEIILELGIIIILIIGFRFLFGSVFGSIRLFSLKKILLLVIDGTFSVVAVVYITGITLVSAGTFDNTSDAIAFLVSIGLCTLIASFIVMFVRSASRKYDYI